MGLNSSRYCLDNELKVTALDAAADVTSDASRTDPDAADMNREQIETKAEQPVRNAPSHPPKDQV